MNLLSQGKLSVIAVPVCTANDVRDKYHPVVHASSSRGTTQIRGETLISADLETDSVEIPAQTVFKPGLQWGRGPSQVVPERLFVRIFSIQSLYIYNNYYIQ